MAASLSPLPSVDPSSTTRISSNGSVWLASVLSASPIATVSLNVGTMAEKVGRGVGLQVVDKVPAAAPVNGDADGDRNRGDREARAGLGDTGQRAGVRQFV